MSWPRASDARNAEMPRRPRAASVCSRECRPARSRAGPSRARTRPNRPRRAADPCAVIILAASASPPWQAHSPPTNSRTCARGSMPIARELGFDQVGVADIDLAEDEANLERWLAERRHGGMDYMARHGRRRSRPAALVPGTLRVISVRMANICARCRAGAGGAGRRRQGLRRALRARSRLPQGVARPARGARRRDSRPNSAHSATARSWIRRRSWKSRSRAMPGLAGSASTPT